MHSIAQTTRARSRGVHRTSRAQTVFPPDDALGGPGFFAFNPLSHLTESSELATAEAAAQLDQEWGAHWSADASLVLEKSPSSLLRMRFLQRLYPDAYFVVILRHPICNAYATHAWGLQHGGKNSLSPDDVVGFVDHWIHAHKVMEADLAHLQHVRLVHLEELAASPQAVVDAICGDLGVASYPVPDGRVSADVNRKYVREYGRESTRIREAIAKHAPSFLKYGYSVDVLEGVATATPSLLGVPTGTTPAKPASSGKDGKRPSSLAAPLPHANGGAAAANGGAVAAGGKRSAAAALAGSAKCARAAEAHTHASAAAVGSGVKRPILLTFGTRGDVQPFIPLAAEMQSRGMQPLIVSLPLFRPLVEENGVAFGSLVDDDEAAAPKVMTTARGLQPWAATLW